MKLLAFAIKYITLRTRSSPGPRLARHQGNAEEGPGLKRIRFCLLLCIVERIITSADNFICYFVSALQLKDFQVLARHVFLTETEIKQNVTIR